MTLKNTLTTCLIPPASKARGNHQLGAAQRENLKETVENMGSVQRLPRVYLSAKVHMGKDAVWSYEGE